MRAYYMRDNHTFLTLPLDVDEAMDAIYSEFCDGYGGGLLCTKHPLITSQVNADGDWESFRHHAKRWLQHFSDITKDSE